MFNKNFLARVAAGVSSTLASAAAWDNLFALKEEEMVLFLELKAVKAAIAAEPAHSVPARLLKAAQDIQEELEYCQLAIAAA